jgi:hypothetical protein
VPLWVGQVLLALAFLSVGYGHTFGFDEWSSRMWFGWMAAVGSSNMRIIAGLETLGSVALILPAATGVLPWLTPLAASCFAALMALAIVFHARRHREGASIVLNAILGAIAALVAYGRFDVAPF